MEQNCCTHLQYILNSGWQKIGQHVNRLAADRAAEFNIKGTVVISRSFGRPGKSTTIRTYSRNQVGISTGKGKQSEEANLRNGKNTRHGEINTITYRVLFNVGPEFGIPGAITVKNGDQNEFFLRFVTLEMSDGWRIHFDCNSWVYPLKKTNADRLFFANTSYLPSKTPKGLSELRQEELQNLRGNGRGQRKDWERIYDYDCYNDLGEPNKGQEYMRPVLGGSKTYPYPRRCRTGRPLSTEDRRTETRHGSINLDFYVPPDERFSPSKLSEFISNSIQAVVHFVIPEVKSLLQGDPGNFESFEQMLNDLYSGNRRVTLEDRVMEKLNSLLPAEIYREVVPATKTQPLKFPVPQIIAADEFAWKSDEEFGREMLAGINPVVIECFETFLAVERRGKPISILISDIDKNLGGLAFQQVMNQRRIFILDHHGYLMPYLRRINAEGVCIYASRTLLFLQNDSTLKPLAIELSLPGDKEGEEVSRVFLPASHGTEGALWQLAKAHVAVNDSGYHQLISHWLNTHAVVEPFIIATRRQLSSMHPIHKLLEPHFKDTMHINSLARSIILNAGGIFEKTMFPGKFSMELSSAIYEDWKFNEQGLPADLLKRGVAVKDPNEPSGVRLLFEDYPYAVDGLEIWMAIKTWVQGFCSQFYDNDEEVSSDTEIQAWWTEIRRVGHGDKRDEKWWYEMNSISNLTEALTTLIWIASALHASVNFGQYAYAGFPANRPTRCRKFIPTEGTPEFAEFLRDPDKYYLHMLPDRFTRTLGLALIEVLSRHTGDEVYMGQRSSDEWTDDDNILLLFKEFGEALRRVEKRINRRNLDPRLKNRRGPARVPYTLMYPDTSNVGSDKGLTGRGIPNSVSI